MQEGIFTQPGPDGIFGRGGTPGDATSPTIDGDGANLRETLVVAYPSPGHMRVARAIRHPKSGNVEFQEQYRMPTPDEVAFLANQGVTVGPGSMVQTNGMGAVNTVDPSTTPNTSPPPPTGFPWAKVAVAVVAGAAGFWAVNKWVVPKILGDESATDSHREKQYANGADDDDGDEGGDE